MKTYEIKITGDGEIEDITESLNAIIDELELRPGKWVNSGTYMHGVAALGMSIEEQEATPCN